MSELSHYNIKGSHWGERRWQYEDGTLTPEGRIRYGKEYKKSEAKKLVKQSVKEARRSERSLIKTKRTERTFDEVKRVAAEGSEQDIKNLFKNLNISYHESLMSDAVAVKGKNIAQKVIKRFDDNVGMKLGASPVLFYNLKQTEQLLSSKTGITDADIEKLYGQAQASAVKKALNKLELLSPRQNIELKRTIRQAAKYEKMFEKKIGKDIENKPTW